MTLHDIINRSMLVCNIKIGREAVVFYNEFVDYLCLNCPQKATNANYDIYVCENPETDVFIIPDNYLFVLDVYCNNRKVNVLNCDNTIIFPNKGTYKIKYTCYPTYANDVSSLLDHNILFDNSLIYFICYKKALQEQFEKETVDYYYTCFGEHFSLAVKRSALKSNVTHVVCKTYLKW